MGIDTLSPLSVFAWKVIEICAVIFVFALGILFLWLIYAYLSDKFQTTQTVRRNYPIIGRFRYFFEHMGEFFRQYFFALDREELPFNRAQRSWVYRAAKNIDSTIAFGSTRPLDSPGEVIFVNHVFPVQSHQAKAPENIIFGEQYAQHPYTTNALINISGMSYGALSAPAITALAMGAKKAGIWMNSGEGGVSPYHLEQGCDLVAQIGTAKYGVRDENGHLSDEKLIQLAAHEQIKMFEIKLSQGAKPGKGGMLLGKKVTAEIAKIRGIPEGSDSISPNGHCDINNISDLQNIIVRIRQVTGKPVGIKFVLGQTEWLDELFNAINDRGLEFAPDFITLDGAEGGTGAAPQSLMDYMGLPLRTSLPLLIDKLIETNLKQRIKVVCSGKLITPDQVAWAYCVGADTVVSARGFLFSLGCIQALQCNKNTCPTGITTHKPELQQGLVPENKALRVYQYATNLSHELEVMAHSCGVTDPRGFKRHHAAIIDAAGNPQLMDKLYPIPHNRRKDRDALHS